jgi:hypothetical protein
MRNDFGTRSNVRFPYSKGKSAKKQTAADKLDERLGETRGKESTKSQSFKSRRDESLGASKA